MYAAAAAATARYTPLSQARTPLVPGAASAAASPGALAAEPTPAPGLEEGWTSVSPGLLQQLAEAATPPGGVPGLAEQLAAKQAESGPAYSAAPTQFNTPQGSFKSGLPQLQVRRNLW